MGDKSYEFLERYHYAVVKSNQGSLDKLKARIGSEWANMMKGRYGKIEEAKKFSHCIESFLKDDLALCDSVNAKEEDDHFSIDIKGCRLCYGNERLRRENLPALCPVTAMGLSSISRVRGRKATLKDVMKKGVVGECNINYKLR